VPTIYTLNFAIYMYFANVYDASLDLKININCNAIKATTNESNITCTGYINIIIIMPMQQLLVISIQITVDYTRYIRSDATKDITLAAAKGLLGARAANFSGILDANLHGHYKTESTRTRRS
jgi:hypothetical protein